MIDSDAGTDGGFIDTDGEDGSLPRMTRRCG